MSQDARGSGGALAGATDAASPACRDANRSPLMRRLVAQFGQPSGLLGRIAGWIMAHRPSNRIRNAWTIELLDVQPHERVLEIGFGPGVAVEGLAALLTTGKVVGIDHSATMLGQARKRNARAERAGRVELLLGSAAELPAFEAPFDKVLAVNAFQFWDDPLAILRRLHATMREGGRIALTLQPRSRDATDDDARRTGLRMAALLEAAGFTATRVETKTLKPVAAVCALGMR